MQVDFWQVSTDPAENVTALIAGRVRAAGAKLIIVSADEAQRSAISRALWTHDPPAFLAHGAAGSAHEARQPILIADSLGHEAAPNGADHIVLADGAWRAEAARYSRAFLLFDGASKAAAHEAWRSLPAQLKTQAESIEGADSAEGAAAEAPALTRRYFEQQQGKWVQVA